jgi:hypothetical protein
MHQIEHPGDGVPIATAALDLAAFPPVYFGLVTSWVRSAVNGGVIPEFDLSVWANAAVDLTDAQLYGGVLHALVNPDDTFVGEADDEKLTAASHGLLTGDGPFQVSNSGGALPGGLVAATDYWIVKVDGNTFKLAASFADAMAGTTIALSTDGTGTQTLADTSATKRLHWHNYGLLGDAGDGDISLGAQLGYVQRVQHHPLAVAYALVATMSTSDPEAVSAAAYPIMER